MAKNKEIHKQIDNTYPDALTNLFVGLFAGSMLFSIQKIHFFEINPLEFKNLVLLMIELIYLVYLVFGYFTLFRVYHRDSIFYKNNYSGLHKRLIKKKFTALVVVVSVLAMIPHSFSVKSFIYFYPTFSIALIFDILWTSAYLKLHEDKIIDEISLAYVFDLLGIVVCIFTYALLHEWMFGQGAQIFSKSVFVSIVVFLHLTYFFPFAALYLRKEK